MGITLDLGCGKKKRKGHIGLDMTFASDADVISDIREGIPLGDNTCDQIVCDNILEHIPDLIGIMNELWRISTQHAKLKIIVPYYTSLPAFHDPTHVRFFCETSFSFFNQSKPYDYGFKGKFDIQNISLYPNPEFAKVFPDIPFLEAAKYFMNAVTIMTADLSADKEYVHPRF